MDEKTLIAIAKQLRKPEGEHGIEVAKKMNDGNQYINRNTILELEVSAQDTILEIGMANGYFAKEIVSIHPSVKYTGLDFSPLMVQEAIRINTPYIENRQVDFILASADNLPFEDHSFNKVFTINTIYFWEDYEKTLQELHRIIKSEGKLLIAIRPQSNMVHLPFVKYGFNMFSKESLTKLLTENRFKVVKCIEKIEPPQEINGIKVDMESLIICAVPRH